MDSQYRNWQWHAGLTDPRIWANTAANLARSAEILWAAYRLATDQLVQVVAQGKSKPKEALYRDTAVCQVAFMLAGYAIENILKGLCVQKFASDGPVGQGDPHLTPLWKTHNLLELSQTAQVDLDKQQTQLLQQLSVEIVWGGRYPRPKKPLDFLPDVPGRPDEVKVRIFSQTNWEIFVALYNKLFVQLLPARSSKPAS